jgi:hypothetical protein
VCQHQREKGPFIARNSSLIAPIQSSRSSSVSQINILVTSAVRNWKEYYGEGGREGRDQERQVARIKLTAESLVTEFCATVDLRRICTIEIGVRVKSDSKP